MSKEWTFAETSHASRWLFPRDVVDQQRRRVYQQAVAALPETVVPLTLDEAHAAVQWAVQRAIRIGEGSLGFPRYVTNCAVTYVRRFYLQASVMDYDPGQVAAACVFLANKAEDVHCGMSVFCARSGLEEESFRRLEMVLIYFLHSDLIVHHPFNALDGFLFSLKHANPAQVPDDAAVASLCDAALRWLDQSRLSDVMLTYAPSQLALAAVRVAARGAGVDLEPLFAASFASEPGYPALLAALDAIEQAVTESAACVLDDETSRSLLDKLAGCRNPALDPASEVYRKRRAEEAALDKKMLLASKRQRISDAGDAGASASLGLAGFSSD